MTGYPFPADLVGEITARRGALHCFDRIDPGSTALIVVDMQTGFLQEGWPTALAGARAIVPTINRLAGTVRDTGGEVIWVAWALEPSAPRWDVFFDHVMGPEASKQFRTLFAPGHEGQALWPGLDYRAGETIVGKRNFSGFSGSHGALERHLRARGLDTVLIAGTVTAVCCESTAREAAFANFKTIMVADANAGRSDAENLLTFSTFIRVFGDVMTAAEITARLEGSPAKRSGERR
ncbi:MAG: isochorismatase family cysteine hydrolase [Casimicrobiaceae bacterium]